MCVCELLSSVQFFVSPWTVGARLLCPWNSPGKNTGVGCHSLLQGIFPALGSNLGLLHCRQILYCLSHQGRPKQFIELPKLILYLSIVLIVFYVLQINLFFQQTFCSFLNNFKYLLILCQLTSETFFLTFIFTQSLLE